MSCELSEKCHGYEENDLLLAIPAAGFAMQNGTPGGVGTNSTRMDSSASCNVNRQFHGGKARPEAALNLHVLTVRLGIGGDSTEVTKFYSRRGNAVFPYLPSDTTKGLLHDRLDGAR